MVEPKTSPDTKTKLKPGESVMPLSRIRTIMKSTENTGNITNESLFLVAKATEMFINNITKNAYKSGKSANSLKYDHLSTYVDDEPRLEFLLQIIPKKIKVREFKEIIAKGDRDESSSESEDEPETKPKKSTNSKK